VVPASMRCTLRLVNCINSILPMEPASICPTARPNAPAGKSYTGFIQKGNQPEGGQQSCKPTVVMQVRPHLVKAPGPGLPDPSTVQYVETDHGCVQAQAVGSELVRPAGDIHPLNLPIPVQASIMGDLPHTQGAAAVEKHRRPGIIFDFMHIVPTQSKLVALCYAEGKKIYNTRLKLRA